MDSELFLDVDRDYHDGLNNALKERDILTSEEAANPATPAAPTAAILHPVTAAACPNDVGIARSRLQAVEFPPPLNPYEVNPSSATKAFVAYVTAMKEEDYGDFMRRAFLYWQELADCVAPDALHADQEQLLARMRELILDGQNDNVEVKKLKLTELALRLNAQLGGSRTLSLHDFELSTSLAIEKPQPPPGI